MQPQPLDHPGILAWTDSSGIGTANLDDEPTFTSFDAIFQYPSPFYGYFDRELITLDGTDMVDGRAGFERHSSYNGLEQLNYGVFDVGPLAALSTVLGNMTESERTEFWETFSDFPFFGQERFRVSQGGHRLSPGFPLSPFRGSGSRRLGQHSSSDLRHGLARRIRAIPAQTGPGRTTARKPNLKVRVDVHTFETLLSGNPRAFFAGASLVDGEIVVESIDPALLSLYIGEEETLLGLVVELHLAPVLSPQDPITQLELLLADVTSADSVGLRQHLSSVVKLARRLLMDTLDANDQAVHRALQSWIRQVGKAEGISESDRESFIDRAESVFGNG